MARVGLSRPYYAKYSADEDGNVTYSGGATREILNAVLPRDVQKDPVLGNLLTVAAELMSCGAAYRRLTGGGEVSVPTPEELETLVSAHELAPLQTAVVSAIVGHSVREIEAEAPKNGEAARDG